MKLPKASRKRLADDFSGADLGDERRVARLLQIVEAMGRQPQASLPDVFETEADLKAAYRFFGSEAFDFDDLLEEHRARSAELAEAVQRVIVVHDTTSCEHEHIPPRELGFLATGKAGFLLHVSLVIDAGHHRRPLGIIHAEPLFRESRSRRGGRKLRLSGTESAKWDDREFLRWSRGVEASAEQLQNCQAVHVMDREGDCYALFSELVRGEHSFVVRCRTNRILADSTKLDEHLAGIWGVLERDVQLSRRAESRAPSRRKALPARPTRTARLRFKASTVELARPRSAGGDCLPIITMNVVRVEEEGTPEGHKPVQWTLWTSLPVDSPEQIAEVVDIYRQRWVIEEYFKALKTGCSYEARLLESRNALLNLLAVTMPIAIEVLWMRARATDAPDAPADDVVTPLQIEILRKLGHRPLSPSPTAAEVLLCVASIGGHQRNNGSPGWLVLKRGYEKLLHYEAGWTAALAGSRRKM
jgi:hypothetical protein